MNVWLFTQPDYFHLIRRLIIAPLYIIKQLLFTIGLNKMAKTLKVMIVIKRSIDILNMRHLQPSEGGLGGNKKAG
jgi:uncharacterized membrane protein YGL010W